MESESKRKLEILEEELAKLPDEEKPLDWLDFCSGEEIQLDGYFSLLQLKALAAAMERVQNETVRTPEMMMSHGSKSEEHIA